MVTIVQLINRIDPVNTDEHHQTRTKVINGQADDWRAQTSELKEITAKVEMLDVSDAQEIALRRKVQRDILETLAYPAMTERYEDIVEAYPETFEWAFKNSTREQVQWSNLSEWLKKEAGVYWISGKAGSGKSTLMKHIFDDVRTCQYLSAWAKDRAHGNPQPLQTPLCLATFFFWNSGTQEQKSQSGLLRALLYQVLSSHPELLSLVFPELWAKRYTDSIEGFSYSFSQALTLRRLASAFRKLTQQTMVPLKMCFLVDGLDEFYGDHEELAALFKVATTSPTVKICVSSRPWVIFEQIYGAGPSLRLQDLTYHDIKHYVNSKFSRNPAFGRMEANDPDTGALLREEVIGKAEGVFLWVDIVVKSLLLGIRNQDDIIILRQRLVAMPKRLEDLYLHLFSLIEPVYLEWASKAFQIVRAVRELCSDESAGPVKRAEGSTPLPISTFFFAITENVQFHSDALGNIRLIQNISPTAICTLTPESLSPRCAVIRVHLTSRCAGLLEIPQFEQKGPDASIQFLHRTARDFLYNSDIWNQMLGYTKDIAFEPHRSMLRASVLDLAIKTADLSTKSDNIDKTVTSAMLYAYYTNLHQTSNELEISYLDNLDQVMTSWSLAKKIGGRFKDVHWTDRILLVSLKLRTDMEFMRLSTLYGLANYVGEKLAQLDGEDVAQIASTLLHILLSHNPWPEDGDFPLQRPEMVSTLLHHGADPNFFPEHLKPLDHQKKRHAVSGRRPPQITPWTNMLRHISNNTSVGGRGKLTPSFIHIMKLLVVAGADPNVNFETGQQLPYSNAISVLSPVSVVKASVITKYRKEGHDLLDEIIRQKSIREAKGPEDDDNGSARKKRCLHRKEANLAYRG